MKSFLIITTNNLPEAYFLVDKLIQKRQKVSVINVQGRTLKQSIVVLKRLWNRRGSKFIIGFLLAKFFTKYYKDPSIIPFPEINDHKIMELRHKVDYHETYDINSMEAKATIESIGPDYILVAGAPVIKDYIFELAKSGTMNRHLGLSPEYRGSDCPIWAMANNDFDNIGFTIHFLSKKVDGGDVLLQENVTINRGLDFSKASAYINRTGSEGYWKVVKGLLNDEDMSRVIQTEGGKHYPPAPLSIIRKAAKNIDTRMRKLSNGN